MNATIAVGDCLKLQQGEKMMRKMLIARGLLVGALAMYLFVPMVRAGNVKATLYTGQNKEATWPLSRDHAKDEFSLTGGVLDSSKYEVRFYYGKSPATWGNKNVAKYTLESERVMVVGKGKTKNKIITQKMCDGDFVKVVMYGNSKAEPKKKCYANAILINH